jgi:P-type Mg2+ transporter
MIQRFMFGLGPISSLYHFATLAVMLWIVKAGPELFRAGWFIESLATQTLVISSSFGLPAILSRAAPVVRC